MTTLTVTLPPLGVCDGGHHLTLIVSGDYAATVALGRDQLDDPISADDSFLVVICKMAKKGRTFNQAKTLLQAGVTVTV